MRAICARELKVALDKTEQSGDGTRRLLSDAQIDYAALDAEVLLQLYELLEGQRAWSGSVYPSSPPLWSKRTWPLV